MRPGECLVAVGGWFGGLALGKPLRVAYESWILYG